MSTALSEICQRLQQRYPPRPATPAPADFTDPKGTALMFVNAKPELFHPDFADWLTQNFAVWAAFERESNRLWIRGRRDYAARTIIEWLRHETSVSEVNGEFKINNNYVPSMAWLYSCHHPDRAELFKHRESRGGE